MSLSNSIHAYTQIKLDLEEIARTGREAIKTCATAQLAARWRFKVYQYRRLLQKLEGSSKYDNLQFIIHKDRPNVVVIENANDQGSIAFSDKPIKLAPDPGRLSLEQTAHNRGLDLDTINEEIQTTLDEMEKDRDT